MKARGPSPSWWVQRTGPWYHTPPPLSTHARIPVLMLASQYSCSHPSTHLQVRQVRIPSYMFGPPSVRMLLPPYRHLSTDITEPKRLKPLLKPAKRS
eukprot:3571607-Rhodomonas_salina.2